VLPQQAQMIENLLLPLPTDAKYSVALVFSSTKCATTPPHRGQAGAGPV